MQPINPEKIEFTFTLEPSLDDCSICLEKMDASELLQHQATTASASAVSTPVFHSFHADCIFQNFKHSRRIIEKRSVYTLICPLCKSKAGNTHQVFRDIITRGLKAPLEGMMPFEQIDAAHSEILQTFGSFDWQAMLNIALRGTCLATFRSLLGAFEKAPVSLDRSEVRAFLFTQAGMLGKVGVLECLLPLLKDGLIAEKYTLESDEVLSTKVAAFELAVKNNHLDVVRLLLESDIRISMDICGTTSEVNMKTWALLWAAKYAHIEILKTLLPFLEDGTIPVTFTLSINGEVLNTKAVALYIAVRENHPDAVSFLLESKAVKEAAAPSGVPLTVVAFQLAVTEGLVETLKALLPLLKNETIPEEFILATGKKINTRERGLAAAQESGRKEVVDLLTDYFAKNPSREGSPSIAPAVKEKRVLRSHSAQTKRTAEPDSKAPKKAKNS